MISDIKCINNAYKKLSTHLRIDALDERKKYLVIELVNQVAFLLVELNVIKEQIKVCGAIQVNSNGRQKQSEASKYYGKIVLVFSSLIKNIYSIIGKDEDQSDDELEKFLKGL